MFLKSIIVNVSVLKMSSGLIWAQSCVLLLLEWQPVESIQLFRAVLASQVELNMTEHSNELHEAAFRSQGWSLIFQQLYLLLDKKMSVSYHQKNIALREAEERNTLGH